MIPVSLKELILRTPRHIICFDRSHQEEVLEFRTIILVLSVVFYHKILSQDSPFGLQVQREQQYPFDGVFWPARRCYSLSFFFLIHCYANRGLGHDGLGRYVVGRVPYNRLSHDLKPSPMQPNSSAYSSATTVT